MRHMFYVMYVMRAVCAAVRGTAAAARAAKRHGSIVANAMVRGVRRMRACSAQSAKCVRACVCSAHGAAARAASKAFQQAKRNVKVLDIPDNWWFLDFFILRDDDAFSRLRNLSGWYRIDVWECLTIWFLLAFPSRGGRYYHSPSIPFPDYY